MRKDRTPVEYPSITDRTPVLPITFAEYIRRKNDLEQNKDPLASTIWRRSLEHAAKEGRIPVYFINGSYFVDWEESKSYVFKTAKSRKDLVASANR